MIEGKYRHREPDLLRLVSKPDDVMNLYVEVAFVRNILTESTNLKVQTIVSKGWVTAGTPRTSRTGRNWPFSPRRRLRSASP
jgi:hypothetical protein